MLALASQGLADPPGAGEAFRDWRLDCPAAGCPVHIAIAGADGSEVLRVALRARPATVLAVTTELPLFLPDGVVLGVGDDPPRAVPWRTCGRTGCEAVLPLDPDLLASLRRERSGSVTLTLVDGVKVRLPFSLLGVTAALRARDGG